MAEEKTIDLTPARAIEAICADFGQYEPQILLFCEIIRLISDGNIIARREKQKSGAWITRAGRQNMRWMDGVQLGNYVCELLKKTDPDAGQLASICARVFQTRAFVANEPAGNGSVIRIETGMEAFECRQCGQCCLSLDYQDQLEERDVEKWRRMGRRDILTWVGEFKRGGQDKTYRMWMKPGTRQLADRCPFLDKQPNADKFVCRIHDVKPRICRQYPVSRKHAIMTGCPGFDDQKKRK